MLKVVFDSQQKLKKLLCENVPRGRLFRFTGSPRDVILIRDKDGGYTWLSGPDAGLRGKSENYKNEVVLIDATLTVHDEEGL